MFSLFCVLLPLPFHIPTSHILEIHPNIGSPGGPFWIGLAQDRNSWRTLVSAVMNLRIPWNAGNFLTSFKPVSCSRRTLHHGVSKYYLYLYPLYPSSHQTIVCKGMLYSACHKFWNVLTEFTVWNILCNYIAVSVSHLIVICDIEYLCSEAWSLLRRRIRYFVKV